MPGYDCASNGALNMLCEEDRIQLQGRTAQQVRSWIASKTLAMRLYLSKLQLVFNSTLPVSTLPNEILVEILCLASALDYRNTWITRAMGVCRHWRDTIVDAPVLWSKIDLSAGPRLITHYLTRSSNTGLGLYVPGPRRGEHNRASIDFSMITPLLAAHHSRITKIHLYINNNRDDEMKSLWKELDVPLPALFSLELETFYEYSWTPSPLPNLRSLSLAWVTPDWTRLPLSQLTSLMLCGVRSPRDKTFVPRSLLDLFETCVSLETFRCDDFDWDKPSGWKGDQAVHPGRIVPLSRMRYFHLAGAREAISELLAQIALSRHAHLSLQPDFRYNARQDLVLKDLLPTEMKHLPALSEARRVMVWHDADDDQCIKLTLYADVERTDFWDLKSWRSLHSTAPSDIPFGSPGMPSLCIRHPTRYYSVPMRNEIEAITVTELGEIFNSAPVETLVVGTLADQVGTQTWARTLATLPNLKHLEIIGQPYDFPPALEPTPTGTPCAQLHELALRYKLSQRNDLVGIEDTLVELRAMLQRRIEVEGGARLESLSLVLEPTRALAPSFVADQLPPDFKTAIQILETVVGSLTFRCIGLREV